MSASINQLASPLNSGVGGGSSQPENVALGSDGLLAVSSQMTDGRTQYLVKDSYLGPLFLGRNPVLIRENSTFEIPFILPTTLSGVSPSFTPKETVDESKPNFPSCQFSSSPNTSQPILGVQTTSLFDVPISTISISSSLPSQQTNLDAVMVASQEVSRRASTKRTLSGVSSQVNCSKKGGDKLVGRSRSTQDS